MPGVPGAVAPGKINLESPPSPPGKGAGGMGAEKKVKAGATGDKQGTPPAGRMGCLLPQCRPGSAAGHLYGRVCTCRKRSNAGVPGAVAPGKKTYSLPLPRRGRGSGEKSKLKAGAAGDKECTPRHLLDLPRGRGPSQTPPSLATDSSISPGPPSPWPPALPIERRFYRFCTELATPKAPPSNAGLAG